MTEPIAERILDLCTKRLRAFEKLAASARAAANQMKDAGMTRGAAPLEEALFELDAMHQEIRDLIAEDPLGALKLLLLTSKNGFDPVLRDRKDFEDADPS